LKNHPDLPLSVKINEQDTLRLGRCRHARRLVDTFVSALCTELPVRQSTESLHRLLQWNFKLEARYGFDLSSSLAFSSTCFIPHYIASALDLTLNKLKNTLGSLRERFEKNQLDRREEIKADLMLGTKHKHFAELEQVLRKLMGSGCQELYDSENRQIGFFVDREGHDLQVHMQPRNIGASVLISRRCFQGWEYVKLPYSLMMTQPLNPGPVLAIDPWDDTLTILDQVHFGWAKDQTEEIAEAIDRVIIHGLDFEDQVVRNANATRFDGLCSASSVQLQPINQS